MLTTKTTMILVTVLLVLAQAQIRVGSEERCKVVTDGIANFFSINFLDNCDMWHAPHIANPFFLMILCRKWWVAFLVSGLFEIIECLMVVVMGEFGLFAGAANSLENLPDVLIDDWLLQAGLGVALGAWVTWYFDSPAMWKGWYTDRGRFMWWLLWYVAVMVPQTTYGINLNDDDPTGFPLGPTICIPIMAVVFALMIQNEPRKEESWKGRTYRSRAEFWGCVVAVYFSFYYVVQFDFFFGSAPQTWLMCSVWFVGIFVWALIRGRGPEILDALNWQVNYVRYRQKLLGGGGGDTKHAQDMI